MGDKEATKTILLIIDPQKDFVGTLKKVGKKFVIEK